MSHLDILLPFSLPPAELAADLFNALKMPSFATLLARANAQRQRSLDEFSRRLPHETWLADRCGIASSQANTDIPVAAAVMRSHGMAPAEGFWFMLQPVHIHIARDHLVLTDTRQLSISEEESRLLFSIAQLIFEEAGKTVMYGDAGTWFLRADDWSTLRTATPDAACGHNIDIWMPKGDSELAWRKLQNEVQMHWHTHQVNNEREARGMTPVNSIWLWGGSPAVSPGRAKYYSDAYHLHGLSKALIAETAARLHDGDAADIMKAPPERGLLVLDKLVAPALAGDWSAWLDEMHFLEAHWFAPLLSALKRGAIGKLTLALSDHAALSEFIATPWSLRKFWVKPALARLSR